VGLAPAGQAANAFQQDSLYHFGDESRVEVEAYVGGTSVGGFSAVFEAPNRIYLPLVLRSQ
jgi:hypothetical protein